FYVDTRYLSFVPPFLLYGVGIGLAIAQLANIVLSDIPADKAGVGSGANNTIRQLGASLGIAVIGAVLFGTFASEGKPMIETSNAFTAFGDGVKANPAISAPAKTFGTLVASFGDQAKKGIETGLDNNEGFDSNADVIDSAITNLPATAKSGLKFLGVDLDN